MVLLYYAWYIFLCQSSPYRRDHLSNLVHCILKLRFVHWTPWKAWWSNGWCAGHRIGWSDRVQALARALRCVVGHCTLIVPLSTQVYKWVLANLLLGVHVALQSLASHPGGVEILLVASCYGNQDKLRPDGPLGSNSVFTTGLQIKQPRFEPWPGLLVTGKDTYTAHTLRVPLSTQEYKWVPAS